ncbi:hypothetical protein GGQ22_17525 [Nocardioides sp. zg-579]|uniref:Uncharacterized protein n=1 Tax=Nocardioides marmotae TaxID=2663857 RepID=A0A6I3JFG5_9ACTN|nr:hypothetical protein [Nocardioides marmotae]MCR6033225.1 hypothetical protein [Gordonia jinghuaiqii]MTB96880.1 hypothetical protein [Nocardioides marmotae]QKE02931.1 hypothetical protein HPC71_19085 [Nocardioides marmotae]
MDPKISDDAVGRLPITSGRAELLEEIMSTPVTDRTPDPMTDTGAAPPRRTAWLVPLAAAAAVAVVATGPLWWPSGGEPAAAPGAPAARSGAEAPADAPAYRAVLDVPGWSVTHVYEEADGNGGEVSYERGQASLEVSWRPGALYEDYVEDRRHIVDPPADGDPVELLGRTAQLWPYSADDHTVIRPVEDGFTLEVRGSGMPRSAFEDLLGDLRFVDEAGFEQALPDEFVTASERDAVVEEMLDGIAAASGQERTPGEEQPPITSDQADRYHLGADVAGKVACAWLQELRDARRAGDQGRVEEAAAVLVSSRQWPVLLEMEREGDYAEVIWDYADQVAAGRVPEGFKEGLGC